MEAPIKIENETDDFLAGVCPIDPDELEACQSCQ